MKIIHFHGWRSEVHSKKINALKNRCEVFAPKIEFTGFDETLELLLTHSKSIVDFFGSERVVLVGGGLGGYWVEHIGSLIGARMVMVNPTTRPQEKLGLEYPDLDPKGSVPLEHRTVLLTRDDKAVDHRAALNLYTGRARILVYETGGHGFKDVDELYKQIEIAQSVG